ncbi:MAG: hypothetical protein E7163_04710 [Firmicutes bacterium]|nr:hypothetical protein [Bacillota bacterium]
MKKLLLIAYVYQEITRQINKSQNQEKKLYAYIASSVLAIALLGFLFKSMGLIIFLGLVKLPIDAKVISALSDLQYEWDNFAKTYNESVDKFNNTDQLLTQKLNKKIPKQEVIEDKNAIISLYLSNIENNQIYKLPDCLKDEVIYILQQDLGVDITDYNELIKLAQEKLSDDTLKRELKIIN